MITIILVALLCGILFGSTIGLLALSAGLLLLNWMHRSAAKKLRLWLDSPANTTLPNSLPPWDELYGDLYRLRKRATDIRNQLEETLSRLREALSALPDAVVLLDADLRIEWCNKAAERLLALKSADYGLPINQLLRQPELLEMLNVRVEDSDRASGGRDERQLLLRTPAGSLLEVRRIPFGRENSLLLAKDVAQIEQANTLLRDFVANVSHELRTPLTVIVGYLEPLAKGDVPESKLLQRQCALAHTEAVRMGRLISDLLLLSRLENKLLQRAEGAQSPRRIDMRDLLNTVLAEAEALSGNSHKISLENTGPTILNGYGDELHSAFANLASNAVRYTPAGRKIKLVWCSEGGSPLFYVQDNGPGIAPEHLERLSERFYRVDRSHSSSTGGTGLGLTIVQQILHHHDAKLEIESTPGSGSCFKVRFKAEAVAV